MFFVKIKNTETRVPDNKNNLRVHLQCVDALPDTKTIGKIALFKRKKYHEALDILDVKLIDMKKKTDLIRHEIKQVVPKNNAQL